MLKLATIVMFLVSRRSYAIMAGVEGILLATPLRTPQASPPPRAGIRQGYSQVRFKDREY